VLDKKAQPMVGLMLWLDNEEVWYDDEKVERVRLGKGRLRKAL